MAAAEPSGAPARYESISGACQTRVHTPQCRRQISAREHSLKAVYLATSVTLVPSG